MRAMDRSFRCFPAALIMAVCCAPTLRALTESDLKDDSGKVIVHYFAEAPANAAPAGTTDPARQLGVIVCLQEHTEAPSADIYPVRLSLKRLGLSDSYVLLAVKAQGAGGGLGAADIEPIRKLVAWSQKTYPVNPRRIYAFGKGSGGSMAGQLSTLNPDLFTASIS